MSENVLQQLQSSYARLQERYDRVNRELDRLHHFLPLLLQHMTEATLFLDLEGTALLCNEAAGKILNLKGEEILRKRFWDVFPDDHFGFSMRETLTFGIPHKLLYNRLDSKELEITATFFYEGAKSGHGLLIILRDISEKQKLHALAHRSDRMRELGERVATIAHEIRNPLGGIRGHAALLYRDLAQDQHLQEMASFILEGTRSLEKLVTMVLHYARPVQILLQSTEMGQFLQQLIRFIKVDPACPPQVKWDLHIPKDSLLVPIDPEALKSALLNLILNALQAMPRGGLLTLSLLKIDHCCQIAISDTGVGMSEEQLQHLFARSFTTKAKGNGLGLIEVEKIVHAHGGTIAVRSHLGKGTTFTLTLPMRRSP